MSGDGRLSCHRSFSQPIRCGRRATGLTALARGHSLCRLISHPILLPRYRPVAELSAHDVLYELAEDRMI